MNNKIAPIFLVLTVLALASLACQFVTGFFGNEAQDTSAPNPGKSPTSLPVKTPSLAKQPTTQPAAPSAPQMIRQWAVSAKASSSYGETSWSATQATGAPNVTNCADNDMAWASKNSNTLEWIELSYEIPVVPTKINIHQSYNPSQVVEVDLISTDGTTYVAWQGKAEAVAHCPDEMAITIELDEKFEANKVVVIVDQSILGLGWNEIDAVELVGTTEGGQTVTIPQVVEEPSQNLDVTQNYTGWLAGSDYQGYLKVIVGETRKDELDGLIGLTGKRSTENWKPRPDHADTFIYDFKRDGMRAFVSVTTDGVVYDKSISSGTYPSDFKLDTVNNSTYEQLDAIYKRDHMIPYKVMASILGHPGFLREAKIRVEDNKLVEDYQWYNANGDQMYGAFFDGKLTGIAGLAFIPK